MKHENILYLDVCISKCLGFTRKQICIFAIGHIVFLHIKKGRLCAGRHFTDECGVAEHKVAMKII